MVQRETTRNTDRDVSEQRITVMLISVVVVFLVCQLPQAIQKLYTVYLVSTPGALTTARLLELAIGGNFCNLLVIVNSAVNFVLYSALSAKFRQTFKLTFCCCRGAGQSRRGSSAAGVTYTEAVPLNNALMTVDDDGDERRHRRRPRTVPTDLSDKLVTVETSDHSR